MTGALWLGSWLGLLVAGLTGAATISGFRRSPRYWLAGSLLAGSLLLAFGAGWRSPLGNTTLILPAPWPAITMTPVPLASLWGWIASSLFLAAVLGSWRSGNAARIFYSLVPLQTAVGIFLWSGQGILLLISWEFLSAVTYLGLVTTRKSRPVWQAGWVLLALSEIGGFLLLFSIAWLIPRVPHLSPAMMTTIMIMVVLAFGVKAGLFPLMIWMPLAEPEAPGAIAGIFSGLLTGLAISGILTFDQLLHPGRLWGILLIVLGVLGALTGALYSVVSRHAKRVLAYSTLEVLGLVFAAMGIWHVTESTNPHNIAATLALDAAVILLIMHAGAKFVAFLVTDFTGQWGHTLDRLGGLIHGAPRSAGWTLLAILTLEAFPPLGGFVGEWLLLESILKPLGTTLTERTTHLALLISGAFLALAIALGTLSYLRWFAFIFLGTPRQPRPIQEPPKGFRAALALPLIWPLFSGPAVPWVIPWLNHELGFLVSTPQSVFAPTQTSPASVLPLVKIGANLIPAWGTTGSIFFPQGFSVGDPYILFIMGVFLFSLVALLRYRVTRSEVRRVAPWTGGLVPFTALTSFSAEGFVHPLRLAFARFYGLERLRIDVPGTRFYRHTIVYRVEEHLYLPILALLRWLSSHIRRIQSGLVTAYLGYLVGAILLAAILVVMA